VSFWISGRSATASLWHPMQTPTGGMFAIGDLSAP